jgi:hypothetical protein
MSMEATLRRVRNLVEFCKYHQKRQVTLDLRDIENLLKGCE